MTTIFNFNEDICHDLSKAAEKEWLETNGIGGYASSTIIGANTRRYHGLLMAATMPPLGRTLLLSKVEEFLCIGGQEFPLSTNFYPNTVYPEGYKNLVRFSLNPFPTFEYSLHGITIIKKVFMVYGENTTVILYQVSGESKTKALPYALGENRSRQAHNVALKIRVMAAFRDYHRLTHENPQAKTDYKIFAHKVCLQPYEGMPSMYLFHNAEFIERTQFWYKNMEYPKERERGLEAHEDHYCPFALHFDLNRGGDCYIVASTCEYERFDVLELFHNEIGRRKNIHKGTYDNNRGVSSIVSLDFSDSLPEKRDLLEPLPLNTNNREEGESIAKLIKSLLAVSDSFIVKREDNKKSIIAGYHWFSDWGRDAMISLPGLTLVQGRFEDAKKILLSYAYYVSKGMIPNRFPDYGETPEYNTVDASLWYIHAAYQYLRFTKDFETIRKDLYDALKEIIGYYKKGTRYNIHMDADHLIYAGAEGVQLTWMDAKVDNWVVTPRMGKAVEINALWHNALKIMAFFADKMGFHDEGGMYNALAQKASQSFNSLFWFHEGQYLYDCINGESKDSAIRPNQIFAVSLPFSMLPFERQTNVVEVVRGHLFTPYGLRTLSPKDKNYIGCYAGGVYERDKAYHQGTVWPWLIGPYISAYRKVYAKGENTVDYVRGLFEPFYEHLFEAGLGTISEIFDGDPPHTPRGCISQAWSVAEILRVYYEHIVHRQDG